jgi:hypothetical protein
MLYLTTFGKYVEKIQFSLEYDKNNGTSHDDLSIFMVPRLIFLRVKSVSDKSHRQNQNTLFMFNDFFHRKSCRLCENMKKYGKTRQATDVNMSNALCMLYN